jgi:hypothetical protein
MMKKLIFQVSIFLIVSSAQADNGESPVSDPANIPSPLSGRSVPGNELSVPGATLQAVFTSKEKVGIAKIPGPSFAGVYTAFELKAPFDEENAESVFATFDGLGNATTVSVSLSRASLNERSPNLIASRIIGLCIRHMHGDTSGILDCDVYKVEDSAIAYMTRLRASNATTEEKSQAQSLCLDAGLNGDCEPKAFGEARKLMFQRERASVGREVTGGYVWNLRAEYGRSDFTYRDTIGLEKRKQSEEPFKLGFGIGWLYKNSLLGGGVQFVRKYQAGDSRELCRQSADSIVECFSGATEGPKLKERENVFLEWRFSASSRFATSPRVIYDTKGGDLAVQVPIYFVGDNNWGLSGGIRFSWDTEKHDVDGELFIGKSFQLVD